MVPYATDMPYRYQDHPDYTGKTTTTVALPILLPALQTAHASLPASTLSVLYTRPVSFSRRIHAWEIVNTAPVSSLRVFVVQSLYDITCRLSSNFAP
jgi:hypothetical protein